jgi:hypothetical protein
MLISADVMKLFSIGKRAACTGKKYGCADCCDDGNEEK